MESTLSGKTYVRIFESALALGYELELHYLWLASPEQAVTRVRRRVRMGGHDVPVGAKIKLDESERSRFGLGLGNRKDRNRMSQIGFHRLSFSQEKFLELAVREREFVLLLGQIHDDLRHARHLLIRENNGLQSQPNGSPEVEIVLHQLAFALRMWYGLLHEAWLVIAEYWHGLRLQPPKKGFTTPTWEDTGRGLASQLESTINSSGKTAAGELKAFFTAPNLPKQIRNKSAFHYDVRKIRSEFSKLAASETHSFVTGALSGNIFYSFAERIRNSALIHSVGGGQDAFTAGETFFSQVLKPWNLIDDFSRSVLFAIISRCDLNATETPAGDGGKRLQGACGNWGKSDNSANSRPCLHLWCAT